MSRGYWFAAALVISSIMLFALFGKIRRARENLFLFLVSQALSWPVTILIVLAGKLENPVRLFPKATDGNFIMAFIFHPAVMVVYYWHYPRNKSFILQIAYTLTVAGSSALVHAAVQKYSNLVVYIAISWYGMWLIAVISYYIFRIYSDWYFSQFAKARHGTLR